MRAFAFLLAALTLGFTVPAEAAPHFPALTGRVVDAAHVLSSGTIQSLDQALADYERGTGNQVVVVTLKSLEGDTIEDYGYQLGRYWGIGHKGKDNGALLIVAPQEHKVRIEVGYGLEGTLTDAMSSDIIQRIILPSFRSGHIEQGVVDGTHAILDTLGGHSLSQPSAGQTSASAPSALSLIFIVIFALWMGSFIIRHPFLAALLLSNQSMRFGGSSFGGGGGGFSGGGGSFGGGGASGSW